MNNKKILIFSDYYYPHWTGISKSIEYLTNALKKSFDFTILTVKFKKNLRKNELYKSTKIIRTNYQFSFSRAKLSLSLIFKFITIIRMFDIVFINSPSANILSIAFLSKIFGKKLIIFHQGDLILPKGLINSVIEKVFNVSTYFSFLLADKISTYTFDYAKNSRLLKLFLYKFQTLLIPIRFKKSSKKRNKKNIILGFAGRFVEEKGFDILLKAIPDIVKGHKNVSFVFAGKLNLEYENFFKKNIGLYRKSKKYINIIGLLKNNELTNFYDNIDFIIVPSRSDCFNLVQAEAMLFNTPAISSNIPGLRYLINKSGFGITFKRESHEDLIRKVTFAIKNRLKIEKNYPRLLSVLDYKITKSKAIEFFLS